MAQPATLNVTKYSHLGTQSHRTACGCEKQMCAAAGGGGKPYVLGVHVYMAHRCAYSHMYNHSTCAQPQHVYMYSHMFTHSFMHIHNTCPHSNMHNQHMCMHSHPYMHTHSICAHSHMHAYSHMHNHIMCACIHTCAHTHTYTFIAPCTLTQCTISTASMHAFTQHTSSPMHNQNMYAHNTHLLTHR